MNKETGEKLTKIFNDQKQELREYYTAMLKQQRTSAMKTLVLSIGAAAALGYAFGNLNTDKNGNESGTAAVVHQTQDVRSH